MLNYDIKMVSNFNVRDELKKLSYDELLAEYTSKSKGHWVVLFNLTGDINIGMCIRTAALSGASKVVIIGRKNFDGRGLVGTDKYIPIEYVRATKGGNNEFLDLEIIKEWLLSYSERLVFIEQHSPNFTDCTNVFLQNMSSQIPENPIFVFGNEAHGIEPSIVPPKSIIVEIPQFGVNRSFNVSTAVSMVLWEHTRLMH